ncbi:MAG: hypothetical protein ABDI19_01365 [Armatimonadota bacterium]
MGSECRICTYMQHSLLIEQTAQQLWHTIQQVVLEPLVEADFRRHIDPLI